MCDQTSPTIAQGRDVKRSLFLHEVDECSRLLDRLEWLASVANLAATEIEDSMGHQHSTSTLHALYLIMEQTQETVKSLKILVDPSVQRD